MADFTFNFGDQLDLLSVLLGDPNTSSDDMFPLALRKTYINRGEIKFAKDSKSMREYVSGTIASQAITLPTDWVKNHVLIVNNIDASRMEVALQDYDRYLNSGDYHWYQWDVSDVQKISFLSSVVNGLTYKLWYFKRPSTVLVDTTDISKLPLEYREASAYWAAYELLKQIGKTSLANQCLAVYGSYAQNAQADMKEKVMDRPNLNVDTGVDLGSSQSAVDVEGKGYLY